MTLRGYDSPPRSEVVVKGTRREFISVIGGVATLKEGPRWWDVWVMASADPDVGPYIEAEAALSVEDLPDWPSYKPYSALG
jgi:hypothetical protein